MSIFPNNYKILLRRLGLLMCVYFAGRLLFLLFNYNFFSSTGTTIILKSFFFGIRYDITAIVISNIIFISLHLLPFPFFYKKFYQLLLKSLFLIVNIPLILLNCIDIGLFRFTGKRSGSEIFSIMSFGDDFINTLPKMIIDFWYLLMIFFGIIFLLSWIYPQPDALKISQQQKEKTFLNSVPGKIIIFLFFVLFTLIGFRGGIQYKPLNILSASRYCTGKSTSLVLNTPFTIIKTFGKYTIEEIHWMTDEEAWKLSPVIKTPEPSASFTPKNVVIIILESFGKEYIGSLNSYKGYTPFLDSLIGKSLVFPNAFANGKRSIDGIPAIVAGLPALISDPFITSAYSGNSITTLPNLLKSKGYSSVFFHGGSNGTMGFDNFSKLAGFDRYFGRNEYNNDDDYDGSWGIYDEPFLQRTAAEINKMKPPFLITLFTLSSHHPYKIPDKYKKRFPEGTLPIHQSIGYADYSLKRFFETAAEMPWYSNTLFVITADHTALTEKPFYRNRVGLFSIPVIYFSPGDSLLRGINMVATQQIDILPTVMDYLHYDHNFFAFGNNALDSSENGTTVNYIDETYQLIHEGYSFILDTNVNNSLFNFTADSSLRNNLAGKDLVLERMMEMKLFSIIQNYNHAMVHNEMK